MKTPLLAFCFLLFFLLACKEEVNSVKFASPIAQELFKRLESSDSLKLSSKKGYQDFCEYLEMEHKVANDFLNNFSSNSILIKLSDSILKSRFKGREDYSAILRLNDSINELIQQFGFNYPKGKDELCFGAFCGGFCEPSLRRFGIPILPDEKRNSYHYWMNPKNQTTFFNLGEKLKNKLQRLHRFCSKKKFDSVFYLKHSKNFMDLDPYSRFMDKTTAEVIKMISILQIDFCEIKLKIVKSKS